MIPDRGITIKKEDSSLVCILLWKESDLTSSGEIKSHVIY